MLKKISEKKFRKQKKFSFIFPVLIFILFLSLSPLNSAFASTDSGWWKDDFVNDSLFDKNKSDNIRLNQDKDQIEIYNYSDVATTVYENNFEHKGITLYENNFENENNPILVTNGDFENGGLVNWTTGGDENWIATKSGHSGLWSARSNSTLQNNENSWIQRDFTGPATLTFYWRIDSTSP